LPGDFRPNATPIPGVLDTFDLDSPIISHLLNCGSEAEMIALIDQMPGDIFANAQFAAVDLRKEFNASLPTHRDFLRGGRITPNSYIYYGQSPENWTSHYFRRYTKNWSGVWASPSGRYATRNSNAGYYGYGLGNTGIALGKTWQLSENRMIGVAIGYDYTRIDMNNVIQKDDMQSFDFAIYGGKRELCGRFTDWHIGYVKNWHDTRRVINGTTAKSNYHDNVFSFGITTGRHVGMWTPSIGVEMIQVWSPSHTEMGDNVYLLNVNRSSYTSLELPVGTRLSKTFRTHGFDLTPELRAFWVPQLGDTSSNMRTSFVSGGSDFLVDSGKFGWSHGRFGTSLTAKLNNSLSASINYDAAVFSGQTRHMTAASMTIRF
jgi:Autotransporter beta-domain.